MFPAHHYLNNKHTQTPTPPLFDCFPNLRSLHGSATFVKPIHHVRVHGVSLVHYAFSNPPEYLNVRSCLAAFSALLAPSRQVDMSVLSAISRVSHHLFVVHLQVYRKCN